MLSYTLSTIICNIYFHIYEHIIVYVITYIDITLLSSYHILHWHDTLSLWINGYITIVTSTYHCERITYHPESTVTSTSTSTNHYRGRISCHPDQRLHLGHPGGPQLRFLSNQRSTVQLDSSLSPRWILFVVLFGTNDTSISPINNVLKHSTVTTIRKTAVHKYCTL